MSQDVVRQLGTGLGVIFHTSEQSNDSGSKAQSERVMKLVAHEFLCRAVAFRLRKSQRKPSHDCEKESGQQKVSFHNVKMFSVLLPGVAIGKVARDDVPECDRTLFRIDGCISHALL